MLRQQFEQIVQEMTETRDLLARLTFDTRRRDGKAESRAAERRQGCVGRERRVGRRAGRFARPGRAACDCCACKERLTNSRKTTQEVVGVADAFDDIRKQLINNRIDTEELKQRLQAGIADPLRTIAQQMFPEFDRRLEKLQAALADIQAGVRLRDQAEQQADDILLAMRKVLDRMIALEDFNEAVELLRSIIQSQKQLRAETQQRHKQKAREFLKE